LDCADVENKIAQSEKSPKKQSEGVRFFKYGTQNSVPCCQKYTPTAFSAISPTERHLERDIELSAKSNYHYFNFQNDRVIDAMIYKAFFNIKNVIFCIPISYHDN